MIEHLQVVQLDVEDFALQFVSLQIGFSQLLSEYP